MKQFAHRRWADGEMRGDLGVWHEPRIAVHGAEARPVPPSGYDALVLRRLLLPEAEGGRGYAPRDDAGQAEFDVPGGGCGDAAECERALANLTPERHVASIPRALAPQFIHCCQRILPESREFGPF